ncbi:MAG TPA: ATP-grasp domain-containing protein [Actinospica sp.]|nr:ATP-grasp domain-containing protein [Actinospica sp.]
MGLSERRASRLLLVSTLAPSSRVPLLEAFAERHRVWMLTGGVGRPSSPSWEGAYLEGHTAVDTRDAAAVIEAARVLHAREPLAGVVCCDETRLVSAARVAEALGLPGSPPEAVAACRDKYRTRAALAARGVSRVRCLSVRSADEARRAAAEIGYPVVVKPRDQCNSHGVTRVDDPAAIAEAYARAAHAPWAEMAHEQPDAVLVEEYLDGPEISVDAVAYQGRARVAVVARKETGFAPSFEETGHLVDAADPLLEDERLAEVVEGALGAVGYHTGAAHIELRITDYGYKIVEINARIGGGLIPLLGRLATGVDVHRAVVDVACGRPPVLERTRSGAAAIRFAYPEHDLVVREVRIDRGLLPAGIERAQALAEPGQSMRLPPRGVAWQSRLAQFVAVAGDAASCSVLLDSAVKALTVVAEPSSPAEP